MRIFSSSRTDRVPPSRGKSESLAEQSLQYNTIHTDITEGLPEAEAGQTRPLVSSSSGTSSFVLYYWCIVPALSTNPVPVHHCPADLPCPAHCPGADGSRAIVNPAHRATAIRVSHLATALGASPSSSGQPLGWRRANYARCDLLV